jgi:hypothetical protein
MITTNVVNKNKLQTFSMLLNNTSERKTAVFIHSNKLVDQAVVHIFQVVIQFSSSQVKS